MLVDVMGQSSVTWHSRHLPRVAALHRHMRQKCQFKDLFIIQKLFFDTTHRVCVKYAMHNLINNYSLCKNSSLLVEDGASNTNLHHGSSCAQNLLIRLQPHLSPRLLPMCVWTLDSACHCVLSFAFELTSVDPLEPVMSL